MLRFVLFETHGAGSTNRRGGKRSTILLCRCITRERARRQLGVWRMMFPDRKYRLVGVYHCEQQLIN